MVKKTMRNIPSVSQLLETPRLKELSEKLSHNAVVTHVRGVLDVLRRELTDAKAARRVPSASELADQIARLIAKRDKSRLKPVINATGVLLHTGLGRAPLAEPAIEAINAVASDYASLEIDLETGRRSQRVLAVEAVLCELTGAEAVLVVNNNAGATLLALTALASGREVIVSRGQLIEIGGSFRLPDVMSASGAILHEVGTTNKTHLTDYTRAINERSAALLLVHPSNYVVVGFSETPSLDDLVQLGRQHGLPVIHDIGSGALIDFREYGFHGEPIAGESILAGADVVLFSGDKLLGGPQCGIVLGSKRMLEPIARHPMTRALRVGKLTLAALEATLRLYRQPEKAKNEIPLLNLLSTPLEELERRAQTLCGQLSRLQIVAAAEAVPEETFLGGGSVPSQRLPTWCAAVEPAGRSVDNLARALRTGTCSVVGRVLKNRLLLDLRSVFPRQDSLIFDAFESLEQSGD